MSPNLDLGCNSIHIIDLISYLSGITEYTLDAFPLYQSWDEGVGKFNDDPKTTEGVSWENRINKPTFRKLGTYRNCWWTVFRLKL